MTDSPTATPTASSAADRTFDTAAAGPGSITAVEVAARAAAIAQTARDVLEVAVGLGVLGILRFQSERPRLEAELERAGLAAAASASRQAGELLDRGLRRVMTSLGG